MLVVLQRGFKGKTQILVSQNPPKHCHGKAKGLIYWLSSSSEVEGFYLLLAILLHSLREADCRLGND